MLFKITSIFDWKPSAKRAKRELYIIHIINLLGEEIMQEFSNNLQQWLNSSRNNRNLLVEVIKKSLESTGMIMAWCYFTSRVHWWLLRGSHPALHPISYYPEGVGVQDKHGRTPLYYTLQRQPPVHEVITLLKSLKPAEVETQTDVAPEVPLMA